MTHVVPARAEHTGAIRAIGSGYGNLEDWAVRPDPLDLLLRAGGLWVALDDGAVAGFAGVARHGAVAQLTDLFVARDRRGGGVGRPLLEQALPRAGTRITFASGDPRALPLYARAGLRPLAPLLYLEGDPRGGTEPAAAGGRSDPLAVAAADAAATGRRRGDVLALLAGAGAYALAGPAPGDYAIVRPAPVGAWLGPAAAGAAALVAFAAAASAAHGRVRLALPGPHPALAPLLERGMRVIDADTFMASDPRALDLERYLPEPDLG
jgi:GNAT superfamily N-acetyltransferase